MRTVASKIWLGCLVIVVLTSIAVLLVQGKLIRAEKDISHLAQAQEPNIAHEMEINLKNAAIGTLAYLSGHSAILEAQIEENEAAFERFHVQYLRRATTRREKEFAAAIGEAYRQFKEQGHVLIAKRDLQAKRFTDVLARLDETDKLFDQRLPAELVASDADVQAKRHAAFTVDEGIDTIRLWVTAYRWSRMEMHKALIEQGIVDCQEAFAELQTLHWSNDLQRQAVKAAEEAFKSAVDKVRAVLNDEDEIQAGIAQYLELRSRMDALLGQNRPANHAYRR